jgi:anti-anti-sigma factor
VPDFNVETQTERGTARVRLEGELDLAAVPAFDDHLRRLEADRPEAVVLDLTDLTSMDSSGLRAIVMADERARAHGRRLAVVPGPPQVRRVFEITQLDQRLELVDDASAV